MSQTSTNYLVIQNDGSTDWQSFTLLGVSSARDDKSKIGQFGSGSKHAVLIALRAGLKISIVSGQTLVIPKTKDVFINNKLYQQVQFEITNLNTAYSAIVESSMTLDFGELDWSIEIPAMIRELISNALDATNQDWSKIKVYTASNVIPEKDKTKVYIEFRADVRQVYARIEQMFLHATGREKESMLPVPPNETRQSNFYRKGVFVTCGYDKVQAMFDYNLGDEMKIDEARKAENYNLKELAANPLSESRNVEYLKQILKIGLEGKEVWEHSIPYYRLDYNKVATTFKEMYDESVVVTDSETMYARAVAKGMKNVIFFPKHMYNFYQAITASWRSPVDKLDNYMDKLVSNMLQLKRISSPLTAKIIEILSEIGLIDSSKPCPEVYEYRGVMDQSGIVCGYADDKAIYLSHEHVTNIATITEELCHYYKGFEDHTREIQEWAFNLASYFMRQRIDLDTE